MHSCLHVMFSCKTQYNYVKFILHCEPVNQSENDSKLLLRIRMDCHGMHKINYRKQSLQNQFLSEVWDVFHYFHTATFQTQFFSMNFQISGQNGEKLGKFCDLFDGYWIIMSLPEANYLTSIEGFCRVSAVQMRMFHCQHDWKGLLSLKWCEMNKERVSRLN